MKKAAPERSQPGESKSLSPRDRILLTAAELFYRHGIHSVGIDRIIEESGVAKMTFYRHFPSKARLVAQYLAQKEQNWQSLVAQFTGGAGKVPAEKLLAIFDALELAIKNPGFCGCPFIKALAEFGPERKDPEVEAQISRHFADLEGVVMPWLRQVRSKDAKELLQPLMSLITGTIVIAQATGQTEVASRNKAVAQTLLEQKQLRRLYIPKRKVSHH
jgi:AcrR family transcriptional regulator